MDLMQMLQNQLQGPLLQQISQQIGASEEETNSAAQGVFAALLGGLAHNSSSEKGLHALDNALQNDHDGSALEDIAGFLGNILHAGPENRAANGEGILGHILGAKQPQVAQQLSQSSGLNMSQIMKLLPILAPIVMSVIGKMRNNNSNQGSGAGGFDLASILMGTVQSAQKGGFGDLIGSVLGGVLAGQQQVSSSKSTGGGGLFGKILGAILKK